MKKKIKKKYRQRAKLFKYQPKYGAKRRIGWVQIPQGVSYQSELSKKDRHVDDYIEYKFKYDGRRFLVKLERMTFGKEQFYSIMEE